MRAKGSMGSAVEVDDRQVVLSWGRVGRHARGVEGPRVIPGWAIAGVELVEPRRASVGFLRVLLEGDEGPHPKASNDPNVVEFQAGLKFAGLKQMQAVAEAIEALSQRFAHERRPELALLGAPSVTPTVSAPSRDPWALPRWYEQLFRLEIGCLTISLLFYLLGGLIFLGLLIALLVAIF